MGGRTHDIYVCHSYSQCYTAFRFVQQVIPQYHQIALIGLCSVIRGLSRKAENCKAKIVNRQFTPQKNSHPASFYPNCTSHTSPFAYNTDLASVQRLLFQTNFKREKINRIYQVFICFLQTDTKFVHVCASLPYLCIHVAAFKCDCGCIMHGPVEKSDCFIPAL